MHHRSLLTLVAGAAIAMAGCQGVIDPHTMEWNGSSESSGGSHEAHAHGSSTYGKPGYFATIEDGRLWVFEAGSEDLAEFLASGEPAKNATKIGVGPLGMSVKSSDSETIAGYLAAAEGYYTEIVDGRVWVFEADSEDLAEFKASGEPAKNVTSIGTGPLGMTVKSGDRDTISHYLDAVANSMVAKPGYYTEVVDGRIWAFPEDAEGLAEFKEHGEPAKNVTLIGSGPFGMTVKSDSRESAVAYIAAAPGFYTEVVDGRVWAFEEGSEDLAEYQATGEPAKNATKIGVGPLGMTVKSSDLEVIEAYVWAPK